MGPRVLFVSQYVSQGGASRVTRELIASLRGEGLEVAYALGSEGPLVASLRAECPVFAFGFPRRLPGAYRLQLSFRRALKARWYRRVLAAFRPDVVYCVTLDEDLMAFSAGLREPCIEHVHALHLDSFAKGLAYLRTLSTFADCYVATSEAVADCLRSCVGVPAGKIRVLYNGVDVEKVRTRGLRDPGQARARLGYSAHEFLVGGAGGLSFIKGVDLFVKAAARARSVLGDAAAVRFVWIGQRNAERNPYWNGVKALADELGIADRISFLDYSEDIYPLLAMLDLVVLPSRAESLPLVAMEAMALERSVVSFPVGGIRELLDRGGGLVSRSFDPEELGELIARLVTAHDERRSLAQLAAENVRANFDSVKLLPRFRELIVEELQRSRAGS